MPKRENLEAKWWEGLACSTLKQLVGPNLKLQEEKKLYMQILSNLLQCGTQEPSNYWLDIFLVIGYHPLQLLAKSLGSDKQTTKVFFGLVHQKPLAPLYAVMKVDKALEIQIPASNLFVHLAPVIPDASFQGNVGL
ncbi:hypothetical protein K438DRAFT_1783271 [Mycena galopus ATCC 62051]|nr:hypothetical protein K438DRAFT_1783271 [Mycena galopus ATCC 62051]